MRRSAVITTVVLTALLPTALPEAQQGHMVGIRELVGQMISSMEQQQRRKVAILDFAYLDRPVDNFGRYLSEQLITHIFLTKKFDVIERRQLDTLLKELELNLSDLVDPENAKRLGKISGVDAIVTGTITQFPAVLAVNARLVETETGRVFAVASSRIARDSDVETLLGGGRPAGQPKQGPSVTATPAPPAPAAVGSAPTAQLFGDAAYKQGYRKAVLVGAADSPTSREGVSGFSRAFTDAGGQVLQHLYFRRIAGDSSSYLLQIRFDADLVVVFLSGEQLERFQRHYYEIGLKGRIPLMRFP